MCLYRIVLALSDKCGIAHWNNLSRIRTIRGLLGQQQLKRDTKAEVIRKIETIIGMLEVIDD